MMRAIRNIVRASAKSFARTRLRIILGLVLLVLYSPDTNGQFRQPNSLSATRTLVKQIYTSQIGIREKGTNSGPAVEHYLRYVHLQKGNPWCAAFVCWVFGKAGVGNPGTGWTPELFRGDKVIWEREPRTKSQEPRFPQNALGAYPSSLTTCLPDRQANSQLPTTIKEPRTKSQESGLPQNALGAYPSSQTTCLPDRQANNQQRTTPSTGDIFGLFFPEKGRIAHTGFIDQWNGTWLITVEGNTNISGSREGDGVYRKRRLVRTVYKVARYVID